MILEFSFSNFGPVNEKVTLSFEATNDTTLEEFYVKKLKDGTRVLKMGMIYGPNNSGKTTILKGLQMLRELILDPLDQKGDQINYKKHLLNNADKKDTEFRLIFYLHDIKYDYRVIFNNDAIVSERLNYYPKGVKALFYERKLQNNVSQIQFGSTVDSVTTNVAKKLEANTIQNVTLLGTYSRTNVSIPTINDILKWFGDAYLPLISADDNANLFRWTSKVINMGRVAKQEAIELLQTADLNINDINITEEEFEIDDEMISQLDKLPLPEAAKSDLKEKRRITSINVEFLHQFGNSKSSKMGLEKEGESSGTIRYYQLLGPLLVALKENSFLFIDEMESSLHPALYEQLILNFLENADSAQLLFTTHNTSLLQERDILRNDTIWFTEKNAKGATELFSLADFKTDKIRKGSSIFNAYKLGKLGAKPKTRRAKLLMENG